MKCTRTFRIVETQANTIRTSWSIQVWTSIEDRPTTKVTLGDSGNRSQDDLQTALDYAALMRVNYLNEDGMLPQIVVQHLDGRLYIYD